MDVITIKIFMRVVRVCEWEHRTVSSESMYVIMFVYLCVYLRMLSLDYCFGLWCGYKIKYFNELLTITFQRILIVATFLFFSHPSLSLSFQIWSFFKRNAKCWYGNRCLRVLASFFLKPRNRLNLQCCIDMSLAIKVNDSNGHKWNSIGKKDKYFTSLSQSYTLLRFIFSHNIHLYINLHRKYEKR